MVAQVRSGRRSWAVHGAQAVECLGLAFMHQMTVDVDERGFLPPSAPRGRRTLSIEGLTLLGFLLSMPWDQMRAAIWLPMSAVLCTGCVALA